MATAHRRAKMREYKKRWFARDPAKARAKNWRGYLRRKYGMTIEAYEAMLIGAAGRCAICQRVSGRLCIDHNHRTGEVRGLLCRTCNLALGLGKDSPDWFRRAAEYMERTS